MVEIQKLKKFVLFENLTDDELSKISNYLTESTANVNELLLKENQITRSLFLIDEGEVSVYLTKGLSEEEIKVNKQGDMFGEMSFLDGKLHSANVKAKSDLKLFIMRKNEFDELIKKNPIIGVKLYQNFVKVLLDMVRSTNRKVKELMK